MHTSYPFFTLNSLQIYSPFICVSNNYYFKLLFFILTIITLFYITLLLLYFSITFNYIIFTTFQFVFSPIFVFLYHITASYNHVIIFYYCVSNFSFVNNVIWNSKSNNWHVITGLQILILYRTSLEPQFLIFPIEPVRNCNF